MLRFLSIRHLAVIDRLELELGPGLTVLTGETGAGKSILVGAVGLLVGGRASADLVRTGEETASIEAIFENGDGREVIVRREISAQGRSRAFVDGALATSAGLRELSRALVDLHGQHEHQMLLDPASHLDVLDAYASVEHEREAVAHAFAAWHALHAERERVLSAQREHASRAEFIAFQLSEIDRVAPKPGEDDELAATRQVLANADKLLRRLRQAYQSLYEATMPRCPRWEWSGGAWRNSRRSTNGSDRTSRRDAVKPALRGPRVAPALARRTSTPARASARGRGPAGSVGV